MNEQARSTPRAVAIIQARMGSTRLPGKVLREIAGKPLLWHIIHRLRRCRTLEAIAIATSDNPRDDAIAQFCRDENVICIRGPEENVLARFALAAAQLDADYILRVSSDAPFLDAAFIDHLMDALVRQCGDYVLLEPGALCAHEGVDPFSRRALEKLVAEKSDDPIAREHVTGYFKTDPDFVRIVYAAPYPKLARAPQRLTVDTQDDLSFAQAVHARLEAKAGEASLSDLLILLERDPKLGAINAHVRQKVLGNQGGLAMLRVDGGARLGYGHVKRGLALARALRDREGIGAVFALNGDEAAAQILRDGGFETVLLPEQRQHSAFAALVNARAPDLLVCDARENLSKEKLKTLSRTVAALAVIDDGSDARLAASHAYYPPVPQAAALPWRGAATTVRIGWEWAVLGAQLLPHRRPETRPRVLISMGGSDPFGLTRHCAKSLLSVTSQFTACFVIGPGFNAPDVLIQEIETMAPHYEILRAPKDLALEFAKADLAIVAFGVTAYELGAQGVPALYIAISEDHARSASAFEEAGMGISLGMIDCRPETIARQTWALLNDETRRADMRASGLARLDGRGAERIAADLAAALKSARQEPEARAR